MKRWMGSAALAAALGVGMPLAHAETFTYHGSLQDGGQAADGRYDLQLTLYSQRNGGAVIAGPVTIFGVEVSGGNFVTPVDFGPMTSLAGQGWVDVRVKPAGEADFTALDDRSPVAPEGTCPGSWTLDGNAGIPSGSYLGTADNTPVIIKSNTTTAAVFSPFGHVQLAYSDPANGDYSTAIGYHAGTAFAGSTMIGGNDDFAASIRDSASRQFIVANSGGVGINTSLAGDGFPLRDELTIAASPALPGSNADLSFETRTTSGYAGFHFEAEPGGYFVLHGLYNTGGALDYDNLLTVNYSHGFLGYFAFNGNTYSGPITVGNPGDGRGNGAYVSTGGVWTNASSKSFKEDFGSVDVSAVLDKLVALPIQTWFYKSAHAEGPHMGPFAEDFAQHFGLGNDEKHISTVDESGVALAAIQGLNRKVENENAELRQQNADLRNRLDRVSARLDTLEGHAEE
jgi:Chaperone of endosialidase